MHMLNMLMLTWLNKIGVNIQTYDIIDLAEIVSKHKENESKNEGVTKVKLISHLWYNLNSFSLIVRTPRKL